MTPQEARAELARRELARRSQAQPTITNEPESINPIKTGIEGATSAVKSMPMFGQTLGQVGQAITRPTEAIPTQLGVGIAGTAIAHPIASLMALGGRKAMESPIGVQATSQSQDIMSKVPQSMMFSPEPTMGAVGTLGTLARTLPRQGYAEIPKLGIEALAFGGGTQLEKKLGSAFKINPMDKALVKKSEETYDIANKVKKDIQNDYAVFRDATKDTPVEQERLGQFIDDLSPKKLGDEVEGVIYPEGFKDDISAVVGEADNNLGKVYKIKDTISKHIRWGQTDPNKVTPDQTRLRKIYFQLDKLIDDSLAKSGMGEEKELLDLINQKAQVVYGHADKIKNMVYDKTTREAGKTGKLVSTFMGEGGSAYDREIFDRMAQLDPKMQEVINFMKSYKTKQSAKNFLKRFGLITAEGLAVGTAMKTIGGMGR